MRSEVATTWETKGPWAGTEQRDTEGGERGMGGCQTVQDGTCEHGWYDIPGHCIKSFHIRHWTWCDVMHPPKVMVKYYTIDHKMWKVCDSAAAACRLVHCYKHCFLFAKCWNLQVQFDQRWTLTSKPEISTTFHEAMLYQHSVEYTNDAGNS